MLVVVMVLVAGVALAAGLVAGTPALLWVALAVSVAGLVVAVLALCRRARPARPGGASGSGAPAESPAQSDEQGEVPGSPAEARPDENAGVDTDDVPAPPAEEAESDAAAGVRSVVIVPGRRRFHDAACRLLVDAPPGDEILLEEAVAEGFSACTTCHPQSSETLAATRSN